MANKNPASATTLTVIALRQQFAEPKPGEYGSAWHTQFIVRPGNTYDRIFRQDELVSYGKDPQWNGQRSILCFVNRETGNIHYSAGTTQPAAWKDGPAVEFFGGEHALYAQFVKDGGWGYKGSREAWASKVVEQVAEKVENAPVVKTYDEGYEAGYAAAMAKVQQFSQATLAGMP